MVEVEKLNKTIDDFESYVSNIKSVSEALSEIEKLFNETKINKKKLELVISSLNEIDNLLKKNLNQELSKINKNLIDETQINKEQINEIMNLIKDSDNLQMENLNSYKLYNEKLKKDLAISTNEFKERINQTYAELLKTLNQELSKINKNLIDETKINKEQINEIMNLIKDSDNLQMENLNSYKLYNEQFKKDLIFVKNEIKENSTELSNELSKDFDRKISEISDVIDKSHKNIRNYVDYIAIQNNKCIRTSEDNVILKISNSIENSVGAIFIEIENIKIQNKKIESKVLMIQMISIGTFLAVILNFLIWNN